MHSMLVGVVGDRTAHSPNWSERHESMGSNEVTHWWARRREERSARPPMSSTNSPAVPARMPRIHVFTDVAFTELAALPARGWLVHSEAARWWLRGAVLQRACTRMTPPWHNFSSDIGPLDDKSHVLVHGRNHTEHTLAAAATLAAALEADAPAAAAACAAAFVGMLRNIDSAALQTSQHQMDRSAHCLHERTG